MQYFTYFNMMPLLIRVRDYKIQVSTNNIIFGRLQYFTQRARYIRNNLYEPIIIELK